MKTLENLWYGEIYPAEQFLEKDSEYFSALHRSGEERERLEACLTEEQREALDRLLQMKLEVMAIGEKKAFVAGFRLAAQLMSEALKNQE